MRILIIILFTFLLVDANAQWPKGQAYPYSRGFGQYGYMKFDSATIYGNKDTNWTPRYNGTVVRWENAGADTAFWVWEGKWRRNNPYVNNGLVDSGKVGLGGTLVRNTEINTGTKTFALIDSAGNHRLMIGSILSDVVTTGNNYAVLNGLPDTYIMYVTEKATFSDSALYLNSFVGALDSSVFMGGSFVPSTINPGDILPDDDSSRTAYFRTESGLALVYSKNIEFQLKNNVIAMPKGGNARDTVATLANVRAVTITIITQTSAIDFTSIAAGATGTAGVTVTGATAGDAVVIGLPVLATGLSLSKAWVNPTNTVNIELYNSTGSAIDPSDLNYTIKVLK